MFVIVPPPEVFVDDPVVVFDFVLLVAPDLEDGARSCCCRDADRVAALLRLLFLLEDAPLSCLFCASSTLLEVDCVGGMDM